MMPHKVWAVGEEVLAADFNTYVQNQTVARFASAAARTSAMPSPALNQLTMLDSSPGVIQHWNGTAWASQGPSELYYHEITAGVNVPVNVAASAILIAGGGSFTFDGGPVWIEFTAPAVQTSATANSELLFSLWDASTDLGTIGQIVSATSVVMPLNVRRRLTPSAGIHTFSIRAYARNGAGSVFGGTGGPGYVPAIMSVRRAM